MARTHIRKDILSKVKRVVLKLGSYVITTPSLKFDRKVFLNTSTAVAAARKQGIETVMVSSGAIVAGMGVLGIQERPRRLAQEQACAAIGQNRLLSLYQHYFKKHGITVSQILLTHDDLKSRKRFLNARNTLESVLEYGALPIINENDTTVVEEIKFGDNDYLSSLVTNLVQADLLVILTDIDGFYDKDPKSCVDASLIPLIESIDGGIEQLAMGTKRHISRGGMVTKIKAAKTAAHFGVPTVIANGKTPDNLARIFAGEEVGTLILPRSNKLTSRKHWIGFTLSPQGVIQVDEGARAAIVERGRSLLPSGIVSIQGEFAAGEPVSCCDCQGCEFARGLTAYGSSDISRIKGLKTSQIRQVLGPESIQEEVINRDDMVLLTP